MPRFRDSATRPVSSRSFPPRPLPLAMPLFWKPYTSDVTNFIEQMKAAEPTLEAEQRAGRALLWDKHDRPRPAQAEYARGRRAAAALRLPDASQVSVRAVRGFRRPRQARRRAEPAPIGATTKSRHAGRRDADVVDQVALARLYGEPLFALPTDLYIPPDALEVFLEAFEGPLDLLLYLIRKQNFNILDIPMAGVTRQYLVYVDEIREHATSNWRPNTC